MPVGGEEAMAFNGEARDAARDRAADAFGTCLERALDAQYRLAVLILGDRDEAEDALHDALEAAWRARGSLRDPERFDAWFGRIVTNTCRDRAWRRRRGPIAIADLPEREAPDELAGLADRYLLRRALRELDIDHRTVLVLRYYADLSVEDIAARTGVRAGTVKSRLHYGLRALRAALEATARREAEREVSR